MDLLVALPPAYWDALLMRTFPGKPLEELDDVDWPRLMRVLQVQEMDRTEEAHDSFLAGKYQPKADEWRRILRHNRLEDEYA
jgi:hypothetical protein